MAIGVVGKESIAKNTHLSSGELQVLLQQVHGVWCYNIAFSFVILTLRDTAGQVTIRAAQLNTSPLKISSLIHQVHEHYTPYTSVQYFGNP